MREDHRRKADLFSVEYHGLVLDDALLAQPLDSTPAGGLRQANALTNGRCIDARLGLQQGEDLAVDLIKRNRLHNLCIIR